MTPALEVTRFERVAMTLHGLTAGEKTFLPQRVFCIGKNYAEHIRELQDAAPREPVVFMKPPSCLVAPGAPVVRPRHGQELHHEVEVVVLIGQTVGNAASRSPLDCIAGVTLGLDLTLRDVQRRLKDQGLPWEAAKAFEHSAPLGVLRPPAPDLELTDITFQCRVNGDVKQTGHTGDMLTPIAGLIEFLNGIWNLGPGDLIFTGTPQGVGPIPRGARVRLESPQLGAWEWSFP